MLYERLRLRLRLPVASAVCRIQTSAEYTKLDLPNTLQVQFSLASKFLKNNCLKRQMKPFGDLTCQVRIMSGDTSLIATEDVKNVIGVDLLNTYITFTAVNDFRFKG